MVELQASVRQGKEREDYGTAQRLQARALPPTRLYKVWGQKRNGYLATDEGNEAYQERSIEICSCSLRLMLKVATLSLLRAGEQRDGVGSSADRPLHLGRAAERLTNVPCTFYRTHQPQSGPESGIAAVALNESIHNSLVTLPGSCSLTVSNRF